MRSNDILYDNRLNKTYSNVKEIFKKFSKLMIEMIQGLSEKNYDCFVKKLPKYFKCDEHNFTTNDVLEDTFVFVSLLKEIQYFVFNEEYFFDKNTISIKYELFLIITNLITSEIGPNYIAILKLLVAIFPPDDLITLISKYLKALYVKHIYKVDYDDKMFMTEFSTLELTEENYFDLKTDFRTNLDLSSDVYFQLSSQMYLFLVILGNLQEVPEAEKILDLQNQEINFEIINTDEVNNQFMDQVKDWISKFIRDKLHSFGIGQKLVIRKQKKILTSQNNEIIASKFFNRVIRSCEFVINNERDIDANQDGIKEKKSRESIKKIYFIINPDVYLISNNNIEKFFEEVDRKTPTNKLKALLNILDTFCQEVKFKKERLGEHPNLKWMLDVDYKSVDLVNFIISVMINCILLVFLERGNFKETSYYRITIFLIYFQILINLAYAFIFLFSKYKFYVILGNEKLEENKENVGLYEKFRVNVLDSFLLNEEIYILLLNILIGYLCLTTTYTTFLVSLQLFTVIKFVPTINEIVIAFKIRIGQLMSMIGFLAIIIFFYSNIGFFFINSEFYTILEDVSLWLLKLLTYLIL